MSKHMPVVGYRLYGALLQELFGRSLKDPPRPPETRFRNTAMQECGKGVKNRFRLCLDCGYHKAQMVAWQRGHRAFIVEFKRLAAIEIFI